MAHRKTRQPYDRFELNDTPTVQLAKTGSLIVALCLGLLIAWMVITPIDEVVRARGAVAPISSTQRLQSEFGGAVGAVHVKLGETVDAGQLIVEFDASEFLSQLSESRSQAFSFALEGERLLALVEGRDPDFSEIKSRAIAPTFNSLPEVPRDHQLGLPPEIVDQAIAREQAAFDARKQYLENSRNIVERQITSARAEVEAIDDERPAVERQRSVAKDRIANLEDLVGRGLASRPELIAAIQTEADYDYQLSELTGRAAVLNARIEELEERLQEVDLREKAAARERITEANGSLFEVAERIARLIRRVTQTEFRSPIAGVIHSLPETVVGRVIEPGGLVAEIVPQGVSLRFEARLSPRDVGFVALGQPVRLKIDAFDFSRYGAVSGSVAEVSPTTITDPQDGAYYEVLVDIPKAFLRDDPVRFALLPGMTGEADIVTGKKTVFEYIWKPIFTNLDLALTER